ncbi:MAG: SAM-dependent methyltransferase [Acidimicrobiia bacterium]|nr:SAM-dependent methyltransferase [Acidimicrobiia bacterium]
MERFDAYMERCLYGPDGFYTTHGVAGRARGDFITSPEVGPLFGAVVANVLDAWWDAAGRPDPWIVYDVGCGPNTLLRSIRRARPEVERPWRLVGVDPAPGEGPQASTGGVERTDDLPDDLEGCVVLGNELLDNLQARIVEHTATGDWLEVHVDDGAEVLRTTDARLDIPRGTRAPLLSEAGDWCRTVLARGPDHLLLFDYGEATSHELAVRGGWLRTYRSHRRGHDPLADPGRWDITVDVAVDQLPSGAVVETQADFLHRWGIDELVKEGRAHWRANAARPDLTAIAMRSRVSEAEALTDPTGLGSWLVIHYGG